MYYRSGVDPTQYLTLTRDSRSELLDDVFQLMAHVVIADLHLRLEDVVHAHVLGSTTNSGAGQETVQSAVDVRAHLHSWGWR